MDFEKAKLSFSREKHAKRNTEYALDWFLSGLY